MARLCVNLAPLGFWEYVSRTLGAFVERGRGSGLGGSKHVDQLAGLIRESQTLTLSFDIQ